MQLSCQENPDTEGSGNSDPGNPGIPESGNSENQTMQPKATNGGLSPSERKFLANLVLVDSLCQQLPVLSPACQKNRDRLNGWIRQEASSPGWIGQESASQPHPVSTTRDSSTATPSLEHQPNGVSFTTAWLDSLTGSGRWQKLFGIISKISPLLAKIREGKSGFDNLKVFLQSRSVKDAEFLATIGLSSLRNLHQLGNATQLMASQLDQISENVATTKDRLVASIVIVVIMFVIASLCWIINNGAEWRRKRNERREMKRSRRASRMLQGLQRARYQQQQQEVMLV